MHTFDPEALKNEKYLNEWNNLAFRRRSVAFSTAIGG